MLPIHGNLDRVRENFARQFTTDAGGLLYRRGQRGAAYRVTAAERDGFIADFNRGVGRLFWSALIGVIAVFALLELRPTLLPAALQPWREAIVTVATVVAVTTIWWRLSNAPARALERRVQVALPLDGAARRRVNFAGLPWGTLALGAGITLLLIVQVLRQPGPLDGTAWAYIAGGAIGFVLFAVLGIIKWRLVRRS